ncbi:DUF5069 domain-containing protein [Leptospirillum ferriphilum]|jgi:hypothetical protein|uniref:DUF5069 domain-containing protein n=1 Tax=Leptospirillum sp. Group II '5-way CG' TaxID=419541 RepID=B6ANW7_9BACT|nr:MAG: Protein of unknown function [Leptospirillum sp. Group II '5-way CG']
MAHDRSGGKVGKTELPGTTPFRPRNGRLRTGGLPWLGRMIDKGRAFRSGTLGDYAFPCSMDLDLLRYLGMEPDAFLALLDLCPQDQALLETLGIESRSSSEKSLWAEVFEVRHARLLSELDKEEQDERIGNTDE